MTPLQTALQLAEERGYRVFPCKADKAPLTEHGFKDASSNREQIERWWTEFPDALIGVPTGKINDLFVYDFDGERGMLYLKEHRERFSDCPETHQTRSDGRHCLYAMPKDEKAYVNSASKIAPGVDTRGEGGYIVWWPAHGFRCWINGQEETPPPPVEVPQQAIAPAEGNGHTQGKYTEGQRHAALLKHASYLRHRGIRGTDLVGALLAWNNQNCDPPQVEADVLRIAQDYDVKPGGTEEEKPARKPLDWRELESQQPPTRKWAIHLWVPMGHVTLLSGAGGTGKSLIAQAMGSCIALQREYLDRVPHSLRALLWMCEDDEDELWRRQVAIAQGLQVSLSEFAERLIVHSYDGCQVELAGMVDQRRLVASPMLTELREQIGDYKADVVFLDNSARLYGGNENDRHQVTNFIAMLTAAAHPRHAAVVLLGHPSKDSTSEYSGSTAWEGAVRGRLYLGTSLPDADKDDEPPGDGVRYLCRRKANYSARDYRRLQYVNGVLVPDPPSEATGRVTPDYARDVVLRAVDKLAQMGQHGVAGRSSPNYLPRLIAAYRLSEQLTERDIRSAVVELQKSSVLVMGEVGKYPNRTPRMALVHQGELECTTTAQ